MPCENHDLSDTSKPGAPKAVRPIMTDEEILTFAYLVVNRAYPHVDFVERDDLAQEAALAITRLRASGLYDSAHASTASFKTFAFYYARKAVQVAARRMKMIAISAHALNLVKEYKACCKEISNKLGRKVDFGEVVEKMGLANCTAVTLSKALYALKNPEQWYDETDIYEEYNYPFED